MIFHYLVIFVLGFTVFHFALGGSTEHSDIILKLLGVYCFFIGTIAIPLIAPEVLPDFGTTDSSFTSTPVCSLEILNARLLSVMSISAIALFPLIPMFILFNPLFGQSVDFYDIFPFLQAVATSGWITLLMSLAHDKSPILNSSGRRLAILSMFIFMHILLVGLVAQISFPSLQNMQILKIFIDINPFSQLYILLEGPQQSRLLFNTHIQRLVDYRLYMFILHSLVFFAIWVINRARLRSLAGR